MAGEAHMYKEFWQKGYRIIPLHGFSTQNIFGQQKLVCNCGSAECGHIGKHPAIENMNIVPLWSESQLENMEKVGMLKSGYIIMLDGLLVVDIDVDRGGMESYIKLADLIPELLECNFQVQSGSADGSFHSYYKLPDKNLVLKAKLDGYPGIDFRTHSIVGAGSSHRSGNKYKLLNGCIEEIGDVPEVLLSMLKRDKRRVAYDGVYYDFDDSDLVAMLEYINPDCDYDTWYRIGMAVFSATKGAGFNIFDDWSSKGAKYPGKKSLLKKWESFDGNTISIGTLIYLAEQEGWSFGGIENPFEFEFVSPKAAIENEINIDTSSVDILRPPGFVGEIAAWINQACRYDRESLAVAASLMTVSATGGMRFIDEHDGITPNLFLFGVAGSATGKESILKNSQKLLECVGISEAIHGIVKSEQEIYRNLIRQQASFYYIDEMGEVLSKITHARKTGNAHYLEGIIGAWMSIYSKADSFFPLNGDAKYAIKEELLREKKKLSNKVDEFSQKRLVQIDNDIEQAIKGIKNPYLCILGLTTPERFDKLMNPEMVVNGFLGRCLIFREANDNPKDKGNGSDVTVPAYIREGLRHLYAPSLLEVPEKIGRVGSFARINTTKDAADLLKRVSNYFYNMAAEHMDQTGLTAIPRRGYEQVAKVSMILAMAEEVRTVEHVLWAFALIKKDIENKLMLAMSNTESKVLNFSRIKILSKLDKDIGSTLARIIDRTKLNGKDVELNLEKMLKEGVIVKKKKTGDRAEKYYLRGE